jgi:hypothetical protein
VQHRGLFARRACDSKQRVFRLYSSLNLCYRDYSTIQIYSR